MANCKWCNRDPFDPEVTTCLGNIEVEFPDGRTHPAVPYSGHFDLYEVPEDALEELRRCGCCKVVAFGFHHPMCSSEQCPVCAGQLISCGCLNDDEEDLYGEKREPVDTEALLEESIHATRATSVKRA
jgi:hypothetical protein